MRWTGTFSPVEARLNFHERRPVRASFSRLDVSSHERAHFFTVAKATDPQLLTTLKQCITDALADNHDFETWQRIVVPRLGEIGWGQPRLVEDPLRQRSPEIVDFTDPCRLRSILWANRRLAYMAVEWGRTHRTAIGLPYVEYMGSPPAYPCLRHRHWAGTILPVHHPWWERHWPPNCWGCECRVLQFTKGRRDRLLAEGVSPTGLAYRTEPPDDGQPTPFFNKRTGLTHEIPAGLDFGWDGNPALDRERAL